MGLYSIFIYAGAKAQTNWINEERIHYARFEFYKAQYVDNFPFDFGDFVLAYSLESPVGEKHSIKMEFPFSKTVGSPYIGIKVWKDDTTAVGELGLRIPIFADTENKGIGGIITDYERFDAFSDTYVSVSPKIHLPYKFRDIGIRTNLGGSILIPVRHRQSGAVESELFARYGLDILTGLDRTQICFGFLGITHLTAEEFETDNTEILIGAGLNLTFRKADFGFRLNYPAGEGLDDFIDIVYTLYIRTSI